MASRLNPYLGFRDNARQALDFYKGVFGGETTIMTFGQGGQAHSPADSDKVMHGQLETPGGFTLMASDAPSDMEPDNGASIQISLSGDDEAELTGYWDRLADGATITAPLMKAPWGDTFGMLTDKFGTKWMVNVTAKRG